MALPGAVVSQIQAIANRTNRDGFVPLGDEHGFLVRAARLDPGEPNLLAFVTVLTKQFNAGAINTGNVLGCLTWLNDLAGVSDPIRLFLAASIDRPALEYYRDSPEAEGVSTSLLGKLSANESAPRSHEQTVTSRSDLTLSETEQGTLEEWQVKLAANDPKSFGIVVADVIKRLERIEDLPVDPTVKLHALSAAASLKTVRAVINAEVPPENAQASEESLAVLIAQLVKLGILKTHPELGFVIAATELVLKHLRPQIERLLTR